MMATITLWLALLPSAAPPVVDLGTIVLNAPSGVAPRAFVIVNPPALPGVDPSAHPSAVRPVLAAWRMALAAASAPPPPEADARAAWEKARVSADEAEAQRAHDLDVTLAAVADDERTAPFWLLAGELAWHDARRSWSLAMRRWDDCVARGASDCPEPALDIATAIDAWARVGTDAPELRPWARAYSGHLFEQANRADEAIAAYREVIASRAVSASLREWAGFQLGELELGSDAVAARAAFELSATAADGAVASASRLRLLTLAVSDGRFEDAALIGLAWDLSGDDAEPFAPDVRELTVQALERLGPTAPGLLAARREQGAVLRDVGTRLVDVAERHADGGRMSWAAAILRAPEVMALRSGDGSGQRLRALEERLASAPRDDARSWGRRVISWCTPRLATDSLPFALRLTVREAARGKAPIVKLSAKKGDTGAFGRCLEGLIPPPEGTNVGGFRGDLERR